MRFIGIDPGLDGAVAALPVGVIRDTPTVVVAGKGNKRTYLVPMMVQQLRALAYEANDNGEVHVVLERIHAMPGQGVRSMFSMGHGLGLWEGILTALEIPFEFVTPQRWKKAMMDGTGKDKNASRVKAAQLFPDMAEHLTRKKDHGRADALLLAEYGRRTWNAQ